MAIRRRPEGRGSKGSGGAGDLTGTRWRKATRAMVPLGALALVAGLLTTAASPASAQEDPPPGLIPEGDWTPDQVDFMLDLIDRTEAALPAFADGGTLDESLLEGMGFVNSGITAPGGWDHWVNMSWLDDEHILDPEHPESLVFRSVNGEWVLEAAMFFVRSGDRIEDLPGRYPDLAWLPGWHTHPDLCWNDSGIVTGCGQGEPILVPMTHVWIVDNACGHRFAGVGVGGLHCGDHQHHPDPPDPSPTDELCSWQAVGEEDALVQVPEGEEGHVEILAEDCEEQSPAPGQPAPPVAGTPGFTG